MESILATQSDILKIIREHPTLVIVKVGELVPRREVILLLLNSTVFCVCLSVSICLCVCVCVCVCVSLLLPVSPVSEFFSTLLHSRGSGFLSES